MKTRYNEIAGQRALTGDPFSDDPEALMELAQASFTRAAPEAVAEDARLGIRSCGSVNGVIVYRDSPEPP